VADSVHIRPAHPDDVGVIFDLVCQLADYERAPDQVVGNPALLGEALFGPDPAAEALIAEVAGAPAGFALFYRTFSTWECRPGIWLEDLYVAEGQRRGGVGTRLLDAVVELARQRGYTRVEWSALNWNTPALRFYAAHGAERLDEWLVHRLDGEALRRFRAAD
jgi:GNAT superfamily N-acetyltransferase